MGNLKMFLYLAGILLLTHSTSSISVASTPTPYTASSPSNDYASPSTIEPTPDSKYNSHYPYSRQFFEPLFNPSNNHLTDGFAPSSLLSPKPSLFHRFPFFPSAQHPNALNPEQSPYPTPYPYNIPAYPAQPPYIPGYQNQPPVYDPHYPLPYPTKFPKAAYSPDCDYQNSPFRNTKPLLFYPKPENYYEPSLLGKPAPPLYRYQPTPFSNGYANSIYH